MNTRFSGWTFQKSSAYCCLAASLLSQVALAQAIGPQVSTQDQAKLVEELKNQGRIVNEILDSIPEDARLNEGCDLPFNIGSNRVLQIAPTLHTVGVSIGDTVISINGTRVSSDSDTISVLKKIPEADTVNIEFRRGSTNFSVRLDCQSAEGNYDLYYRLAKAMENGQAKRCLNLLTEIRKIGGMSFLEEGFGTWCLRVDDPYYYNENYDEISFELTRLQIQQLKYLPGLFNQWRMTILSSIDELQSRGALRYSQELDRMFSEASEYIAAEQPSSISAEPRVAATGTCFVVSPDGKIITNRHVIADGKAIQISLKDSRKLDAKVLASSSGNDLAVLKIEANNLDYISLAEPRTAKSGMEVFTLGYPVTGLLGSDPKFTDGVISSPTGLGGDAGIMQITVPLQPGNSGGPLVNYDGEVVGITTLSANYKVFAEATGALPQNVNWAVKAEYAALLFDQPAKRVKTSSRQAAINRAQDALCYVEVLE